MKHSGTMVAIYASSSRQGMAVFLNLSTIEPSGKEYLLEHVQDIDRAMMTPSAATLRTRASRSIWTERPSRMQLTDKAVQPAGPSRRGDDEHDVP